MAVAYTNPKRHDQLFKWLITSFIDDFFDLFFPRVQPQDTQFMDKEFLERLQEQKAALTADLFLALRALINGQLFDLARAILGGDLHQSFGPQHFRKMLDVSIQYVCAFSKAL